MAMIEPEAILDHLDVLLSGIADGTFPDTTEGRDAMVRQARTARAALLSYREALGSTMVTAVRADLERIDVDAVPGGHAYRATVLWLADTIDKRGTDDGPSVTAKLADQMTKVMQALTRTGGGGDDDGFSGWSRDISEPVVQP